MKEEKSFVYTLVLGICILLCLLMVGRMLLGKAAENMNDNVQQVVPQTEGEYDEMAFRLTEDELGTLVEQSLPLQLDAMEVKINKDATVAITAQLQRQSLADSGWVPGNLRTALLFLPEKCKLYGAWKVSLQDHMVKMDCQKALVAGFALPEEIQAAVTKQIENTIANQFAEQNIVPGRLQFADGALTIFS